MHATSTQEKNLMAIDLSTIKRSTAVKPPRVVLYGQPGIGKTSFAAGAPSPIFLCLEDGLGVLDVPHWDLHTYTEALAALDTLLTQNHDFQTVVIDTLDKLETRIQEHIAEIKGKPAISEIGFAKGYDLAVLEMEKVLAKLNQLREKGMIVLVLCHSVVARFTPPDPDLEPYDLYSLDLHKKTAPIVKDWADIGLFAKQKVFTRKTGEGFNEQHKALGTGERIILTEERPSHWAKNRYFMPYEIQFPRKGAFQIFQQTVKESIENERASNE